MTDKIKNFGGFRVIDGTSASFHLSWLNDKTVIYFVRTDEGKEDGFIYFNGKKYGTGKLSSKAVQDKLTELTTEVNAHIANKASVTATARTSGITDNGALSGDTEEKWLTGTAIEKIKTYVDSEDVKSMVLTTDNKIQLKNNGNAVLAELDAKSFIKDGMLQSVTLVNDTTKGNVLRFTWNTDGEKTVTDIEVSEFFHEILGDNTTITVTQPASGETGSLQISAKTVANYQDVTSGSTELITAGATALYVGTHITGARNEMTNTISLSSTKNYVTYASAEIEQFYGTIRQTGSSLVLNVATGLTTEHAGFVYNSDTHTFTAKESSFTIQGLLDAQEVITLLRNNNTNVANALTYLKGQITELSGKMTTVTGSTYITVTKPEGTNDYTVSASDTLQTAITHANSAVQSVNGKSGNYITIYGDEIIIGGSGIGPNVPESSINDVFTNIYSQLNSEVLREVVGYSGITVSEKESGSQTISVKAKPLSETEKAAGQIEIITTGTTGIYGRLYFGGDDSVSTSHNFSVWRGKRSTYNQLGIDKKLDYWTLYSVIEPDGTRSLYWGAKPTVTVTGELYPVTDIVSELPTALNVGDRYIVGHDGTFDSSGSVVTHAEYYIVEIAADATQSVINPLGSFSARVKNRGMKCYMLINDRLVTYDNQLDTDDFILDCGTY